MRRTLLLVLLVAVAGCGDDNTATTTTTAAGTVEQTGPVVAHRKPVIVRETEFELDPAQARGGEEGLVRIKIVNQGNVAHALAVEGPNGEVDFDGQVDPHHTGILEVDLDKPGTYKMWCPLGDHRAKGMQGTITVGGSNPARGEEGTATTQTQTTPTQTETQTQTQTQTETQTQTQTETETHTTTTSTGTY